MARQAGATDQVAHRPWALPDGPWLMAQSWERLLFAHWPVEEAVLRRLVPAQLPIDSFDDTAWIGIVPFEVRALRLHGLPPLPIGSRFPELNVRTYVTLDGRPGVYFFSLDAASAFAVIAARRTYRLPYFHAQMMVKRRQQAVSYRSHRVDRDARPAELALTYSPLGEPFNAAPGTLEHFLIERYCLYTLDHRQRVRRADIHHPPWLLRAATAEFRRNTMTASLSIPTPVTPPLLHYASRQDVVIWPPVVATPGL
jgi:uncharacterized protein YqjF (DUF2071 family)